MSHMILFDQQIQTEAKLSAAWRSGHSALTAVQSATLNHVEATELHGDTDRETKRNTHKRQSDSAVKDETVGVGETAQRL